MTEPATDKHLDELSKRVDFGFEQTGQRLGRVEDDVRALRTDVKAGFDWVDREFAAVGGEMNARFEKVDREFTVVRGEMKAGFDGLQRQLTRFFAGTLGAIVAGVVVNVILFHS